MKFGVLGTGMVGNAIGSRLIELGHEVRMGSRQAGNEKALAWVASAGDGAGEGDFSDAAAFGELLFNCTAGGASLAVLEQAGDDALGDKVLVDIANPLAFSDSGVSLSVGNTDSLAEQIQRAHPGLRVVKALNTITASLMLNPGVLSDPGIVPICGNDGGAKADVVALLAAAGWPDGSIVDLGDITKARATEGYLPLWLALFQLRQSPMFNISIVS